ncbi:MAG: hypothetical protein LBL86_04050 [Coriobacteriales bacterium]|jgi:hypothetical protein|nr:hypothetical protein [Coriobacteriales bacterium]
MAYEPEKFANKKREDEEIRKAQQRAKEDAEKKRRIAEAALKNTMRR